MANLIKCFNDNFTKFTLYLLIHFFSFAKLLRVFKTYSTIN